MGLTRPNFNNINSTITQIDDPIIEINAALGDTVVNGSDLGFVFKRGAAGDNVAILWDRTAATFVLAETQANGSASGDIIFTNYSNLHCNNIQSNDIQCNTIVTSTLSFPTTDGTTGQAIVTNGSGLLSWTDIITNTSNIDGGSF